MNRLGDALSLDLAQLAQSHYRPRPVDEIPAPEAAGPSVKALIVYNCNPAAVAPDQARVQAGLRRDDLFTVVLEQFQTDTADYADYVLPATTQLEHWDILKPYGHLSIALNRPAIAPLGESLPNSEIFRRLAVAMGYEEACFGQDDVTVLQQLIEAQSHERFATITWDGLLRDGFARLNLPSPYLPFAEGNFGTPSGKCEFFSQRMADDGYDPLPTYTPPLWALASRGNRADNGAGPHDAGINGATSDIVDGLVCISPPAHSFLNSSFANIERFKAREKEPLLHIHPEDARSRFIEDGAVVDVSNAQGSVRLTARLSKDIIPGTVLAPGIWWSKFSPDGRNINQVTIQDEADMGAGASFYDVLVDVERVDMESVGEKRSV